MTLTAKRELFAQGVADGLNQSDSYRISHDASGMKPATLWDESSKLAAVPEVSQMIVSLKQAAAARLVAKHDWNADRFIEEAEVNLKLARFTAQLAPANGALKLIGEVTGVLQAPLVTNDVKITKVTVVLNHRSQTTEIVDSENKVLDAGSDE